MNNYLTRGKELFLDFFTKGHERSIRAKKNILASLVIRGLSIGISLLLVPLTINYVNSSRYGLWLTISSIVGWLSFFDIGLTQGLRNRFAEAKAKNDDNLAKIYVSTTYALLCLIFAGIWLIFIFINNFLDWAKILKVEEAMRPEVTMLAIIVFTYFCLSFVLRIVTTILLADQKPAKSSLIDLLGQIATLLFILVLVRTTEGSLVKLGIALCLSPLIVLVTSNFVLFRGAYRKFRPVVSHVRFTYVKQLFNLGLVFFIIQFAGIVQFQTANIIIVRNFGAADVTAYNIVYKYFGVLSMIFTIFITPFWSASTEAYHKNDIQWIKNGIKKYKQLNILLLAGSLVMLIFSGTVYRLWLGEGKVLIPFSLSLWGFIYYNISMFGGKYVSFLNGISALRIQFISCIISPFLYVAVAIILIKNFNMGVYALFISSIIANFNGYILAPLQYYKIIVQEKKGIWIR